MPGSAKWNLVDTPIPQRTSRSGSAKEFAPSTRAVFVPPITSPSTVNTRVGRTKQFIVRTGVDATPTVIVNGRYRVRGRSFEDILRITDQLIVRERNAARAGDAG